MKAEIAIDFDSESEYAKTISVSHGEYTIEHWVKTLSIAEQQEWRLQHSIHEAAVHAAVAAGDAEIVDIDPGHTTIKWRSEPIHVAWMKTISEENNASYHNFWHRYHAAMQERNAK